MGTRIVIMNGGEIQQIDAPKALYDWSVNMFVAGFIGSPQMNFLPGTVVEEDGVLQIRLPDGSVLGVSTPSTGAAGPWWTCSRASGA